MSPEPHVAFKSEPHNFLQGLRSCMDRISLSLCISGLLNAAPSLTSAACYLRTACPHCMASSVYSWRCHWRGPSCDQCPLFPSAMLLPSSLLRGTVGRTSRGLSLCGGMCHRVREQLLFSVYPPTNGRLGHSEDQTRPGALATLSAEGLSV